MKKLFCSIIALLLVIPFTVFGLKLSPSVSPEDSVEGANTKALTVAPDDATAEINSITFKFVPGNAISNFKCAGDGEFELESQSDPDAEGAISCKFTVPNNGGAKGSSITVGKITFDVTFTDENKNCDLEYYVSDYNGKTVADTGVEIPYVVLGCGVALIGAIYFATSKKTKLFKI